ncbi:hypothetical protein [Pontibacter sp. BAB1700]|uniref:hypothetical protein n=1 Tax=Pontibacter sp. BAB1700 TaxID=1144253 RepID=UPI001ED8CBF1|nr:hypothetical protein [Pontibacter sp. BAB1700]
MKNDQDQITGYITDLTLRNNVLAKLIPYTQPVRDVMDQPLSRSMRRLISMKQSCSCSKPAPGIC